MPKSTALRGTLTFTHSFLQLRRGQTRNSSPLRTLSTLSVGVHVNLELRILKELLPSRERQFERLNIHLEEETWVNLLGIFSGLIRDLDLALPEVTEKIVALDGIIQIVHF